MKKCVSVLLLLGCLVAQGDEEASPGAIPMPDVLSLEFVLDYALEHNHDILRAREWIREQEGLVVEVRAAALPRVGASGGYERLDRDLSLRTAGLPQADDQWRVGLEVRQVLYQGGAVSSAIGAQKHLREGALLFLESVINEVLLEVRVRYYEVLLQRERIEVEEQNVRLLEEQLADMRRRFEVGEVSQFEVLRAEVFLANARPALIRATNALRTSGDRLRQVLGYVNYSREAAQIAKIPEFADDLVFREVTFGLEEVLERAVAHRPELKRLECLLAARREGVEVAQGGYWPKVEAVGGYGWNKSPASHRLAESLEGWNVGVQVSWAIFDGAATRGRVTQARSQYRQAALDAEALRLAVEVEVRQAYSGWKEASQLVVASAKVVEQAEEAYRLANARYASGAVTQLDVLQAQVSLAQAREQRLEATYAHEVGVARLRKAMGFAY